MGIIFLVDEDMAGVAPTLRRLGHTVYLVTELLPQGTFDSIVCKHAEDLGAVVVTRNRGHFMALLGRRQEHPRAFRRAGLLVLSCARHRLAKTRLELHQALLELEHELSAKQTDARMLLELSADKLTVHR